jgi:formamidopyrimidine-DNA glycosylase
MTGALVWRSAGEPEQRFDHVVFRMDGGELRYNDMRKLHGLRLPRDEKALERILGHLGPDAFTISKPSFVQRLARRGRLKAVLADQSVIAGLGNLLVDEILWRAQINPLRSAQSLSAKERARVYTEMRRVLRAAIPTGRVPTLRTWLTGRRDTPGAACPRCRATLARRRVGGRTTVWCPRCQPPR